MSALFLLVIASLCVAGSFLGAFIWCIRNDQYDDQKGSAYRILFEDTLKDNKHV